MTDTRDLVENYRKDFPVQSLFVIEGPAGAGKSTLVNKIRKRNEAVHFPVVKSSLKGRKFKDDTRIYVRSAINDFAKIYSALEYLIMGHKATCVDRAFVSQWVYNHIRKGHPMELEEENPFFDSHMQLLLKYIIHDFYLRGFKDNFLKRIDFHFIFLLPPVETLQEMRDGNSDKKYPNPAIEEDFWYRMAADFMIQESPRFHLILNNPDTYFEELSQWPIPGERGLGDEVYSELFDLYLPEEEY